MNNCVLLMTRFRVRCQNELLSELLSYGYEFKGEEKNLILLNSSAELMKLAVCIEEISKLPFPFDDFTEETLSDGSILLTI